MQELFEDMDEVQFTFAEDDDEDWDEDWDDQGDAFTEKSRVQFRRGVPRIQSSLTSQRGVQNATLRTPSGSAQLKLPTSVVPLETFNKTVASLRGAHNELATQVNANRDALKKVSSDIGSLQTSTKRAFRRERKRANEAAMMSSLMGAMTTMQLSSRIDQIPGAPASSMNPMMMMMMPMMSMMDGGDHDKDKDSNGMGGMGSMMMMMMMMSMMGAIGSASHT